MQSSDGWQPWSVAAESEGLSSFKSSAAALLSELGLLQEEERVLTCC